MITERFTPVTQVAQTILNGSSCAVLVEGEEQGSDAQILKTIFLPVGPDIKFHGRDGRHNLIRELPDFVNGLPASKVFAVLDRDFMSEDDVNATYADEYNGHFYFWRRYCIENYLLQPALIAECIAMTHRLDPDTAPQSLATEAAIEAFILDQSRRLAPQVAGNWTIHELSTESDRLQLNVQGPSYFADLTARDMVWVAQKLQQAYSGWNNTSPELFSSNAILERFEQKLNLVMTKIKAIAGCYEIVDGKRFLKKAILGEVPSSLRPYFFDLLADFASKNPPADMKLIIEERILPRWRKARDAIQP